MNFKSIIVAAALAASALPAMATTVTVYTDKAAWLSAVGGAPVQTEDFSDNTLVSGLTISTTTGNIGDGVLHDRLTPGLNTTFGYTPNLIGLGGNFDLSPGGAGLGLQLTLLNGSSLNFTVPTEIDSNYTGQFFGIVSSDAFSSLRLNSGTQPGSAETYNLDNLVLAAVPEPETYAMLLAGLGLVAVAKRRKAKAA